MADPQYHQYHHYGAENDCRVNDPEPVDVLSPATTGSNIERELQRQYQWQYNPSQRSPMTPDHAEKEAVVVGHDSAGLHVVPSEHLAEYPQTATTASPLIDSKIKESATPVIAETDHCSLPADRGGERGTNKMEDRKILGLKRNVFLALAIALVVIIAAAIGGGVGGAVGSKKSDSGSSLSTSSTSSSTGPSLTASSPTSSTSSTASASVTPTIHFLNNETWPKSNTFAFQGFSRDNFTGVASNIVTGDGGKEFGVDFQFDLYSYVWIPNINNCCINFCLNSTKQGKVGWHCGQLKKEQASGPFPRIKVWCDDTQSQAISDGRGCDTPK